MPNSGLELHIYDFDGTLFRSPHPPAFWGPSWWGSTESLMPPCVPDDPSQEWWVTRTVTSARASIGNPNVYAVLITGRGQASGLRYRVPELLRSVGLHFDEVHLNSGGDTYAFKIKTIKRLLQTLPDLARVVFWDDNLKYLRSYESALKSVGLEVETHYVKDHPMPSNCEAEVAGAPDKRHTYLGAFLDSASKGRLIGAFPLVHDKVFVDHITMAIKPSKELLDTWVGQRFSAAVVGYAEDEYGQVAQVELLSPTQMTTQLGESKLLHVTMSMAQGTGPKYSNDLLIDATPVSERIRLTGLIGTGA